MNSKFIKVFYIAVLSCLIGLTGVYLGSVYAKKQMQEAEQKEEEVSLIAVVDLDEGIIERDSQAGEKSEGETKRYYAAEMMTFPNENFKRASLEEARRGISNGTFGAYVIIPAAFSDSVESLNFTPVKSIITYSINPNLSDEARLHVENDIDLFWRSMSEQISYMYISSIMTEFHDVQDESEIILDNDIEDMDNIDAIKPEELTGTVEFSEMEVVDEELEYIDLSSRIENNAGYVQGIVDIYSEAQTLGEEQLTGLSANMENIYTAKEGLDEEILALHFIEDVEGNLVIQEDIDALEEELLLTEETRKNCKEEIRRLVKSSLYEQETRNQTYVNEKLSEAAAAEQQRFHLWYTELQEKLKNEGVTLPADIQGFQCMTDVSVDLSQNRLRENQEEVQNNADSSGEENGDEEINSFAIGEALSTKVENIDFVSEDVVKIIKEEIEPKVITVLTDGCNIFQEKMETVHSSITDYITTLSAYTPLDNLDQEGLTENVQGLNENISEMQTDINEKVTEEIEYIADVYTAANKNVETLKSDITAANQETITNVNTKIAELKTNREKISQYNEEILTGFSTKLPYSRLGELENQQVNSYVAAPLIFEEIVMEKQGKEKIEDHFELVLILLIVTLAICAVSPLLLYGYLRILLKQRKRSYRKK